MTWTVETLNKKVDDELEKLPVDLKAKFIHIVELIESFGANNVREPYVKPLRIKGKNLWELE